MNASDMHTQIKNQNFKIPKKKMKKIKKGKTQNVFITSKKWTVFYIKEKEETNKKREKLIQRVETNCIKKKHKTFSYSSSSLMLSCELFLSPGNSFVLLL